MHNQHRLQLANRMHLQLMRELGHGIDVGRMLTDARYARDVLLVCDALPEHGLPALSARFREAEHEDEVARPMSWAQDTSGFGVSVPAGTPRTPDVDIDIDDFPAPASEPQRRRGWLKAARWFVPR